MYILLVRFISEYLIYLLFFSVIFFLAKKDYKLAIKIVISVVLSYLIRTIVGHLWNEPRPFMISPEKLLYPTKEIDSSFFSGHAAMSFALAGSVFWTHKKLGYKFLIAAGVVALGRVLAGLHYPWDVIAGAGVGLGISYLVYKLYPHVTKKFNELRSASL